MAKKKTITKKTNPLTATKNTSVLLNHITSLIESSRSNLAVIVNRELTLLYWQIGHLIHHEILQLKRADYGDQIIATLSHQLTSVYGKGFTRTALVRMKVFSELFIYEEISATLSHQLNWSHFVELIGIKEAIRIARQQLENKSINDDQQLSIIKPQPLTETIQQHAP